MRAPRRLPAVVAVLVLGAAVSAGPASARAASKPSKPAAPVPAGFVGMNLSSPLFPQTLGGIGLANQLNEMVKSGVQTIRVVFDWSYAQPYASWSEVPALARSQFTDVGGVPIRFGQIDEIVGLAAAWGLRILPTVMFTPSWDAYSPASWALAIPSNDAPFAAFCAALVQRYGPHGSFWIDSQPADPIRSWQIWNEPNIPYYWDVKPFQQSYVGLLQAAHGAIGSVDPKAKVVLAGLAGYSWQSLRAIYEAGGGKLFNVVSAHPYTKQPSGVIVILRRVRRVMNQFRYPKEPIIADEVSWPSSAGQTNETDGIPDIETTPAGQAKDIAQLLPLLARNRKALVLSGFDYYTWAGLDDPGGNLFDFSGLFHVSATGALSAKPAYYAFRRAALALER
jgi:hypothetical protein